MIGEGGAVSLIATVPGQAGHWGPVQVGQEAWEEPPWQRTITSIARLIDRSALPLR